MNIAMIDPSLLYTQSLARYVAAFRPDINIRGFDTVQAFLEEGAAFDPSHIILAQGEDIHPAMRSCPLILMVSAFDPAPAASPEFLGVISKKLSCRKILEALVQIDAGSYPDFTKPDTGPDFSRHNCVPAKTPLRVSLTPRERDVLHHLAQGKSNKDIARALDLQVVTIKLHVRGICRKMGVQNRTQAALTVREHPGIL